MRVRALFIASIVAVAFVAHADDQSAAMPPDIAAIIAKMKGGAMPTAAEMAKLKAWQTGVAARVNAPTPANQPQAEGIPVRIRTTESYTVTGKGYSDVVEVSGWGDALLFPALAGNGDYYANTLNPDAPASSFRIMPLMPAPGATEPPANGGGSVHRHSTSGDDVLDVTGQLTHVEFGAMLTTTGKGDALFAAGGGFGAWLDGTIRTKSETRAVHDRDLKAVLSSVTIPFTDEQRHPAQGNKPSPLPTMNLSFRALEAAVKSGKTTTVSATEQFNFSDGVNTTAGNSTLDITLRPLKLELVIQPVVQTDFEKWMPAPDLKEGGGDKRLFDEPKALALRVVLHDTAKAGPAKGTDRVPANSTIGCALELKLHEVSKHDGVAMNFPADDDSSATPDLFFPKHDQAKNVIIDADGQTLHVPKDKPVKELVFQVAARDTGGSGWVEARCDDLRLTSRDPRTSEERFVVPIDDNHNKIADAWEKKYKIYDQALPPDWDAENVPSGMASNGDGLTLFEEYRGVIDEVDGKEHHNRLDPTHMKLFVWLDGTGNDVALWRAGAKMYGSATNIEIRFIHDRHRLRELNGSVHWLNFHHTEFTVAKQCAVPIRDQPNPPLTDPAFTKPIDGIDQRTPLTPATTQYISVSHVAGKGQIEIWMSWMPNWLDRDPGPTPSTVVAGAKQAGIDLNKFSDSDLRRQIEPLLELLITWETMHELGHATGGRHHFVDKTLDAAGAWDASWKKYGDTIPDDKVKLYKAAAGEFSDNKEAWDGGGDHACPMRYWNVGPVKTDLVRFLVGGWKLTGPADGGAWKFCSSGSPDWPQMRIKPK